MAQVEEPTMSSDKSDNNDDDDDDDSSDVTHRLKPVDIKDIRKKEVGGINIKNMRRKLGKEDKMDRQTERERIKRKHKEIKLKKRKERQAETGMVGLRNHYFCLLLIPTRCVYIVLCSENGSCVTHCAI